MSKPAQNQAADRGQLPDFPEDDRNLVVLAIRSGFSPEMAVYLANVDPETVNAWLDSDEAEATAFTEMYANALDDTARTAVLAATKVRDEARENPDAARRYLRELAAQRDLERARELTAGS
jgi:hypothetical protein